MDNLQIRITVKKKFICPCLFMLCLWVAGTLSVSARADDAKNMLLWYDTRPGDTWTEPLPIGNGYLAGLVYGKVQDERIALNETSFWSGRPRSYDDPAAGRYFRPIRDLVFNRRFKEAEEMIDSCFYGKPVAQQAYQPLGDLRLFFYDVESYEAREYYRDLDLQTGITTVSFSARGIRYKREAYVSYPDQVMVVRLTADRPGAISFDAWLDSHFADRVRVEPGSFVLDGVWEGPLPRYWLIAPEEGKGMKFQTVLKARVEGGRSGVAKNKLRVQKADAVTLLLTAATSHVNYKDISGDPAAKNRRVWEAVAGTPDDTLRRRQAETFRGLMGRVRLSVGDPAKNRLPIDARIRAVREGADDPGLEALCFQFGRYMLAASSRPGGQPAHLQAIWNEKLTPPWGSKYTLNINIQMNYWPAEVANLSECHLPLLEMVRDLSETGARTAQTYYGASKGWVTHHNTDLWRGTAPVDGARYGMWPVGGAWLCQHVWEHYAFTGDLEFLKTYYPVLKGAAEFLADLLIEHPATGYLVTPFSMSPEHGFYDDAGRLAYVSPGPMMDIALLRELFPHVIEAARLLKTDGAFRKRLEGLLRRLPPYQVNSQGYPQEWIEDFKYRPGGHDVSPYFPFYPGQSVQLRRESDREMVEAYRRWMESRGVRAGGFPGSWNICMWARLERGDRVSQHLRAALPRTAGHFLLQGTGAQVDAPFGFTAGIAEALLQSHAGEISLLPALPLHWAEGGEVCGLRARGNYEVAMKWAGGRLVRAEISRPGGGECRVRYNGKVRTLTIPADRPAVIEEAVFPKDSKYYFDGSMPREVLERYLDRSVTAGYFLVPGTPEGYAFPYREDDIRMLRNLGAKFVGRAIYRWSEESRLADPAFLESAKTLVRRMHAYDPEMIFQGCLFEHVSRDVDRLPIPAWVFEAFGLPVEPRNFDSAAMVKRLDPKAEVRWGGGGGGVPMIHNLETRLWFYFLAKSYIDIGCEALHLGQVELIGADDPDKTQYAAFLQKVRDYARLHARRHYVLLDGHTPKGGFVKEGVSLLDFNSFPLRIKEVVGRPMEGILEIGHNDALYGRSQGAVSPSGWKAESLPYLVEFDNFGLSKQPGVANPADHFCWGYDDITWFARQEESYRNRWLRYAFHWLRKNDPNGHLQMCVIRMIYGPEAGRTLGSYFANTKSEACPVGYSQEETIKEIWNTRLK